MEGNNKTIRQYNAIKAARYDKESSIIRGERIAQRNCLIDILSYLAGHSPMDSFVELGCGTGYFTEVLYEVFPNIIGKAIDGSRDMLDVAEANFKDKPYRIAFEHVLMEDFKWESLSTKPGVVFSALAIHHLEDHNKWCLYRTIYENMASPGFFILFDSFCPRDKVADEMLEYLACKAIRRRLEHRQGQTVPLQKIIEKDREAKAKEGDQEASLEEHFVRLREIGFKWVATVFQEERLAGLVAQKEK